MKHIAIKRPDGGVSIMTTANDDVDIAAEVQKWEGVQGPSVGFEEIDPAIIPKDREFRNAWRLDGGKIDHDMGKAREIYLEQIRKLRDEALKAQDIELMKALGAKNQARIDQVAAEQQRLRDIPQSVRPQLNAAKDINELKQIKPI